MVTDKILLAKIIERRDRYIKQNTYAPEYLYVGENIHQQVLDLQEVHWTRDLGFQIAGLVIVKVDKERHFNVG